MPSKGVGLFFRQDNMGRIRPGTSVLNADFKSIFGGAGGIERSGITDQFVGGNRNCFYFTVMHRIAGGG